MLWKTTSKWNYDQQRRPDAFIFWYVKNLIKKKIKTTTILCPSKAHQIKRVEIASVFHRNCVKKLHRSKVDFSSIKIKSEKVHQTGIDIFAIKIVSKRFWLSPIEITLIKVRRIDVAFSLIEITSEKYIEITWKLIDNFFSTYRCNIGIRLTYMHRDVSVGMQLGRESISTEV